VRRYLVGHHEYGVMQWSKADRRLVVATQLHPTSASGGRGIVPFGSLGDARRAINDTVELWAQRGMTWRVEDFYLIPLTVEEPTR
jgi:hypothetical protein